MHDINLQHLSDGMYCKAQVRPYVNWPLTTSIPMWTESEKQT